jgi:thiamine biosynthesis lipoprotein ApbE/formylglycine-generating enzyme required for sulfatase activity
MSILWGVTQRSGATRGRMAGIRMSFLVTAAVLAQNGTAADEHEAVRRIHDRIVAHQPSSKPGPYSLTIPNTTVKFDMVSIPAGEFTMGSSGSDPNQKKDEQPSHKVRLDGFWMQAREVTWDEYRLFMFENQAGEKDHKDALVDAVSRPTRPYVEMSFGMGIDGFPAISMTQHAALKFAEWLSAKTGEFYRLPTEAEWEYACRADSSAPFGGDQTKLGDYAWFGDNSNGKYQKVGTKRPNAWGLYDMLGNVMEWTLDGYAPYKPGAETNPWIRPTSPYPQAVRGGSWNDPAGMVRCAARVASDESWKQQDPQLPKSIWYMTDAQWLGFRLVRPMKIPSADEMYSYWNNGVEHDEAGVVLSPDRVKASGGLHLFQAVEPHMGTLVSIKLYAHDAVEAQGGFRAAFDRIAQLDGILSDYKHDSELSRIARTAVRRTVEVSEDLFHVLAASQELADRSGGAFDITIGPVVSLWRDARKKNQLPDPRLLESALSRCGYRKLHFDFTTHTVLLDQPGMQLDVGGIAKGYAADEALAELRRLGIGRALVAVSGDLAFSDAPPGRKGWRIEIAATGRVVELEHAAVSTSGDAEQHLDVNARRYSHIIDPITGIALGNGIVVSVIAPHGVTADGLSTAISVLDGRRGADLVRRYPDVSFYVRHSGGPADNTSAGALR